MLTNTPPLVSPDRPLVCPVCASRADWGRPNPADPLRPGEVECPACLHRAPRAAFQPRVLGWPDPVDVRLGDGRRLAWFGLVRTTTGVARAWQGPKGLTVLASVDPHPRYGPLLHLSVAYPGHYPAWRDLKQVRGAFFPADVDVMQMLPAEADIIRGADGLWPDSNVFHLWQCPAGWGVQ